MFRIATILCLATCAACPALVQAQQVASVGFRNETKVPLIVQGHTIIQGVHRRGAPLLIPPGRSAFDLNAPQGPRFYTVYDANQPTRVYLQDFPVLLGGDVLLGIRFTNPARVDLFPAQ